MKKTIQLIQETLDQNGYPYAIRTYEDTDILKLVIDLEDDMAVDLYFIAKQDHHDVSIRMDTGIAFHQINLDTYRFVNMLNEEERFLKFYLDEEEKHLHLATELPQSIEESTVGNVCMEMMERIADALEMLYRE